MGSFIYCKVKTDAAEKSCSQRLKGLKKRSPDFLLSDDLVMELRNLKLMSIHNIITRGTLFYCLILLAMTKVKVQNMKSRAKSISRKVTSLVEHPIHNESPALQKVLQEAKLLQPTRGGWRIFDGINHLVKIDKKFIDLIGEHGIPEAFKLPSTDKTDGSTVPLPVPSGTEGEHYFSLLKIIIYQQLSAKSAGPILDRFVSAFNLQNGSQLTPELVNQAKFESAIVDGKRKILMNGVISGLSERKSNYIKDLTRHYLDPNKLKGVNLAQISDEELRNKLIAVKGLGPWSVDIFMLFDLQRSNVLPMGDLVVRKGVARFFGHSDDFFESKKNLALATDMCKSWAPYSSLATCYMWKVKGAMTIKKSKSTDSSQASSNTKRKKLKKT